HGYQVWVNLDDYLDTGLFLDHRPLRRWLLESAADQDFLNLFAYTGAATVAAARGGARSTTSVDLSNTYLEWAERNLALNLGEAALAPHRLVREDVLKWLAREVRPGGRRYGVIMLDPPSFSTSKRMEAASFDVQRDHLSVLRQCLELLTADGTLWFSNNLRSFTLDDAALVELGCEVEDRTRESIPPDYARNDRIHRCWRIRRRT
ncbi:MAG: class I SAM-dependent methyltransferase, partial [Pseudomonadota bacterium]